MNKYKRTKLVLLLSIVSAVVPITIVHWQETVSWRSESLRIERLIESLEEERPLSCDEQVWSTVLDRLQSLVWNVCYDASRVSAEEMKQLRLELTVLIRDEKPPDRKLWQVFDRIGSTNSITRVEISKHRKDFREHLSACIGKERPPLIE